MSSRNFNDPSNVRRDYGAISGSSSNVGAMPNLPDVSFSSFSPTEYMSLTEDIGLNIHAINSGSKQLEKILRAMGLARDPQVTREKVQSVNAKTNPRIQATSKDLQRLTAVVRRGDKEQRLRLEKLTNDFRAVMEKYSAVQRRLAKEMLQSYTQSQVALMSDEEAVVQDMEREQRQQLLKDNLQFEQDMLKDREQQIKQLEVDILDVNAIMRTIGSLVQEQNEHVDHIENSIENVATDVELGREELAKASASRRSYRRKILILLAIAVIVGLIVTIIIVSKLSS